MDGYTTSELLKAVAARRKREQKICAACNAVFEGIGPRLYCSRACADHTFYIRHKAERNAARVKARARRATQEAADG